MDVYEIADLMKKLGMSVPSTFTKEGEKKLHEVSEEFKNKFQNSLPDILNILVKEPEKNKELLNSVQETLKEKFGLP
jgi:hypothetical protein